MDSMEGFLGTLSVVTVDNDFRPTVARPLPPLKCTALVRNGERAGTRCRRWAVYGAEVCLVHGATLPVVREAAQRRVEEARMRLFGLSENAVDALEQLLEPGTAEGVRLKAATEVLDRAGVRGGVEVSLTAEVRNPADEVKSRLERLRKGFEEDQPEVIDGELADAAVDDVPGTGDGDRDDGDVHPDVEREAGE